MIQSLLRALSMGLLAFISLSYSFLSLASEAATTEPEPEKGIHGGRLLADGTFLVELAIFETGVPPELRVWITNDGKPVNPEAVSLSVALTRLGDVVETINFKPVSDFLRGDKLVYEPHSFLVAVIAAYEGKKYQWQYDDVEGRTRIAAALAKVINIQVETAGEANFIETVEAFGRLAPHPDAEREISARFDGEISKVHVNLGQAVKAGDDLITINSNESLKSYTITAPINGVITSRVGNAGEQTGGRNLLSIVDPSKIIAELSVFPMDRQRVAIGAKVTLHIDGRAAATGRVTTIDPQLMENQSSIVRVEIDALTNSLSAGQFVRGDIEVARYSVPLAVKRLGLQSFRDFTVVYAKVGDEYEVRMLELGRVAGEWVEVLGGLNPGTEYVTDKSFIIKADIEKSGASHDH